MEREIEDLKRHVDEMQVDIESLSAKAGKLALESTMTNAQLLQLAKDDGNVQEPVITQI